MFVVIKKNVIIIVIVILAALFLISAFFKSSTRMIADIDSRTVVIDAGHGGMDCGCVGIDDVSERDINLKISKKLEKIFTSNGYKVVMTRENDDDLCDESPKTIRKRKTADLRKRAEIANNSKCGLFISIHMNKYESPKIFGAQVFYNKNDKKGEAYSKSVMEYLKKVDPKNKRLAKAIPNKNLVFSNLEVPGILVECGFLSNPEECKKLQEELYQTDIANAIYNGIVNCK